MAPHLQPPEPEAAEDALISLVASGGAERLAFGNDALWVLAGPVRTTLAGVGAERTTAG